MATGVSAGNFTIFFDISSMTIPRIYIVSPLEVGARLTLDDVLSKRLLCVLRLRLHEQIILFNGKGKGEFWAKLIAVTNNQAVVQIEKFVHSSVESPLWIHLGQGVARGEKMDFVIQKTTELGVSKITPLFTEYCNVKLKNDRLQSKMQHWQAVAIGAAEQSRRLFVPQILEAKTLEAWLKDDEIASCDLRLILQPDAQQSIADCGVSLSISLLVGPEGGLSNAELELAQKYNFVPVRLGPRILRTETAALAVIGVLQAYFGDL